MEKERKRGRGGGTRKRPQSPEIIFYLHFSRPIFTQVHLLIWMLPLLKWCGFCICSSYGVDCLIFLKGELGLKVLLGMYSLQTHNLVSIYVRWWTDELWRERLRLQLDTYIVKRVRWHRITFIIILVNTLLLMVTRSLLYISIVKHSSIPASDTQSIF